MGSLYDSVVTMKSIGFLFPGQGAQFVGMGQDFYSFSGPAKSVFDQANQILGDHISDLCFQGPEAELTRTRNAQIAIFVTSLAVLKTLHDQFPQIIPSLACGLSLGEFTALVALESMTFEDGLRLVKRRGELMEEACQKNPGTMASLLGISIENCLALCKETNTELANLNSYDQFVISGPVEAVNQACELAKTKGAKRVIPLKVGGAFHSSLMNHAKAGLEEALKEVRIAKPKGTFIPNVTGEAVSDPETIRTLLAKQLTSSVQWIKTMETISKFQSMEFLELGPGKVLKGLARKINPNINVINLEKKEDFNQLKLIAVEP